MGCTAKEQVGVGACKVTKRGPQRVGSLAVPSSCGGRPGSQTGAGVRALMRQQGWDCSENDSRILAPTGLCNLKTGPKRESWLKRGFTEACLQFASGETLVGLRESVCKRLGERKRRIERLRVTRSPLKGLLPP